MTGFPGNARPSSSAVRRTPVAPLRSLRPEQWGHCQSGAGVEHQRHCGMAELPRGAGQGQWPLAGPAARRLAAGLTYQRRRVAGAGHLDQHRPAFQPVLGGPPRGAGKPRHQGQGVAFLFKAVRGVQDARNRPADERPLRLDGHGPAGLHQPLQFRAPWHGPPSGRRCLPGPRAAAGPRGHGRTGHAVRCGGRRRRPSRPRGRGPGPGRTLRNACRWPRARTRPGGAGNSGSGEWVRHRLSGGRCRSAGSTSRSAFSSWSRSR